MDLSEIGNELVEKYEQIKIHRDDLKKRLKKLEDALKLLNLDTLKLLNLDTIVNELKSSNHTPSHYSELIEEARGLVHRWDSERNNKNGAV